MKKQADGGSVTGPDKIKRERTEQSSCRGVEYFQEPVRKAVNEDTGLKEDPVIEKWSTNHQ